MVFDKLLNLMRAGKTLYILILLCMGIVRVSYAQNTIAYTDQDFHYKNGLEYLNKGVFNAAREQFEAYLRNADDLSKIKDAEYYRAYSALVLYHNDGELLVNDFIENNPTHPKATLANYELGMFYYNEKNYRKATVYLSKVSQNTSLSKQNKLEAQFKLAYSYFTLKEFDPALKYFNVIKRQSNQYTAAANYYAGYIEYQKGDYAVALLDLEKAMQDKAYERVIPLMICNVHYASKNYNELVEFGEKSLAISRVTGKADIQKLVGEGYFFLEDYTNAVKYYSLYTSSVRRTPESAISYRIGYSYFILKDYENAAENLKKMASSENQLGILGSYYLGLCYLELDNPRFAANAFEHVMKSTDPSLAEEGMFHYAKVSFENNETALAISTFQEFIKKYPNSKYQDEANDLLTELYLNGNNYDEAITHIESMPRITSSVRDVYQKATYFKGVEYFNRSKFPLAVRSFEKSLNNQVEAPYTVRANYWMGEAFSIGRFYEEAIDSYMQVLNNQARSTDGLDVLSYYGLGYAYFNTKVYDQALTYFKKYVDGSSEKGAYYEDALLRLADCYYAARNYSTALQYYRQTLQKKGPETDYALLQTGLISAIEGDRNSATFNLNKVIQEYPQSKYWVNAIFELGQFYLQQGEYDLAIPQFARVIEQKPKSPFTPYSYLKRATAYYNKQEYSEVIVNYKTFLDRYPKHPEGNNALVGLQEALSLANRLDEFDTYLANYKAANPDKEGLEAVEYETSKNQYFNQNYEKAIEGFMSYIERYPNDVNSYEAKYYVADSYYRLDNSSEALKYYYEVYEENKVSQINRVVQRIAELEFEAANYAVSEKYFGELASLALTRKQEYTSWSGLMRSHFAQARYDSVDFYAQQIIEKGLVSANAHTSALLHLGKTAFARGQYDSARRYFDETIGVALDENAAEAKYTLAQILSIEENYEASNELLYELHQQFASIGFWYDKSFVLIADNFMQLDELFQARETLNSLIENTTIDEIKREAEFKLGKIAEIEEANRVPEAPADTTIEIEEGGENE